MSTETQSTALTAISPIDGRYHSKTTELIPYASEFGLMKARLEVEIEWLIFLSEQKDISELPSLDTSEKAILRGFFETFSIDDANKIKQHESITNHDIKALEYFIQDKIKASDIPDSIISFVHFCCTSEDINNLAYALMTQRLIHQVTLPNLKKLTKTINDLIQSCLETNDEMLAKTHGQPASPTRMSKELTNILARIQRQLHQLNQQPILGKINGAVGNFNAHLIAYPTIDWIKLGKTFIEDTLNLEWNPYTTQIEPHDNLAEISHNMIRINQILLDASRDFWGYIAFEYFTQQKKESETGSSTMPHKINPIDFENAEGNLGISSELLIHFSTKLTISRFQRDLSDSTVLRNLGTAFAHHLLAVKSMIAGIKKLKLNNIQMQNDLSSQWSVLGEAVQTVLRKHQEPNAYEILKALTRGAALDENTYLQFIEDLSLPEEEKIKLKALTPQQYTGLSKELVTRRNELMDAIVE